MTTPLPCPFCGHTGVSVVTCGNYKWRAAECLNCGARAGEVRWKRYEDGSSDAVAEMDAINEWNTRATS